MVLIYMEGRDSTKFIGRLRGEYAREFYTRTEMVHQAGSGIKLVPTEFSTCTTNHINIPMDQN